MGSTWFRAIVLSAAVAALGAAPALAGGDRAGRTSAGTGDFTGRHTMTGEVTSVDESKGTMSIKTPEGTMDLHFPPSALKNVKKGDRVSVELALRPEVAAGRPSDTGGSASPGGKKEGSTRY